MNNLWVIACLLVSFDDPAQQAKPLLSDLAWIAGCWESGEDDHTVHEHWMGPSGGTMIGMSRTITDGKTASFEFLRIHEETDGIYYTSIPSGQKQASFKLVKWSPGHAVFENPQHDFPQP